MKKWTSRKLTKLLTRKVRYDKNPVRKRIIGAGLCRFIIECKLLWCLAQWENISILSGRLCHNNNVGTVDSFFWKKCWDMLGKDWGKLGKCWFTAINLVLCVVTRSKAEAIIQYQPLYWKSLAILSQWRQSIVRNIGCLAAYARGVTH